MAEKDIINAIMLEAPINERLFRNNTGRGWVGRIINRTAEAVTLLHPRPLHAGLCTGSSDLIGWRSVEITPEMVGKKVAVFRAIEVKTKGVRVTPEQQNFVDRVNEAGGLAEIVVRDS